MQSYKVIKVLHWLVRKIDVLNLKMLESLDGKEKQK